MFESQAYPLGTDIGSGCLENNPADNINAIFKNISSGTGCQVFDSTSPIQYLNKCHNNELPDWSLPIIKKLEELARKKKNTSIPPGNMDAESLLQKKFTPLQACVPGLLPEGLALLAGPPKIGKSYLALQLALSVATGQPFLDHFPTDKGWAHYFALEDGERRLQRRLLALGANGPMLLRYSTTLDFKIPLEELIIRSFKIKDDTILQDGTIKNDRTIAPFRLFVVDTMGAAFSRKDLDYNDYKSMYDLLPSLNSLAQDLRTTILLVHHTRKQESLDPFDSILGSQAIRGSCNTILMLQQNRFDGEATLFISGRDVEQQELVIAREGVQWKYVGPAQEVPKSDLERQIFTVLKESHRPLRTKEVWERVKETYDVEESTVSKKLMKLQKQRLVVSPNYGVWQVP